MSTYRKILKGSLLRNLEFFIMVVVTFVMTPFIVHTLGDRMYGFWSLVATFIGYYGLLDFGLTSAIARFISRGIGRDDLNDVRRVVSTSFVLMVGIGIIAVIITLFIIIICPFFIKDQEEVSLFQTIIFFMGISIAAGFPVRVFGGMLTSHLRYDYITFVSIIRIIFTNTLIYYFLGRGMGLLTLALINVLGNIFQYLALAIYCYRVYPEIRISFRFFEKSKIKVLFEYSSKTFIAQLADILRFRVDSLVIAGFLSLSLVTYYSIAARIMDYFVQLIVSSVGVMGPLYSQMEGRGDMDSVRNLFEKVSKVCVVLSIFVGTSILFYGRPFIERWMGTGFDSSYYVLLILSVGYMLAVMQSTSLNLLYGISKHSYFAYANILEGVLNLIISVILVRYYGIYGVALGTSITMSFFKFVVQPIYTCRIIDYSLKNYFLNIYLFTILKISLPLGAFYLIVNRYLESNYLNISLIVMLQVFSIGPLAYCFSISKPDRVILKEAIFKRKKILS